MDISYYRQQRSWGKVIFLHVSCDSVHGGGSASVHAGIPTPWQGDPPGQGRPPPPGKADPPPLARQTTTPPCAVHTGRYGEWVGGMNPTGMQFLLQWMNFVGHHYKYSYRDCDNSLNPMLPTYVVKNKSQSQSFPVNSITFNTIYHLIECRGIWVKLFKEK